MAVAFLALVAFSAVLAKLTLTPSPASAGVAGSNMHPGHSLREYVEDYSFLGACKQIIGNLVLGAPFGVLLPVLVPRRLRMIRVVVITLLVMALVELAQGAVVEGRAFDVDDVILNTAGAIVGYVLFGRPLAHLIRGRRRRGSAPAAPGERAARAPVEYGGAGTAGAGAGAGKKTGGRRFLPGAATRTRARPGSVLFGRGPDHGPR
ncbi:VanZ family protein [Streptomyces tsukubensis]|uniref:VanZ-like domain-containing protein n=1 Tax=Streptomyces tsukubensis TaxID=83656 RepID=A0A1V4A0D3_9ACTN|nr:VanZ family protein [Streptomyces tsukubensis]OON72310.1 hypothetical protein B1H18_30060 [Streptomyces tsukubensis]